MKTEPQQPDSLGQRVQRREQRLAGLGEAVNVGNPGRKALRASDDLEIGEFDLERYCPPGNLGPLDPRPGVTGDPLELGGQCLWVAQAGVDGALGADRFVRAVW